MARLTFIPGDVTVDVRDGENLLRAAMAADVLVTASCGGDGTCGKCRMVVESGEVRSEPGPRLTEEQIAKGYVLACRSTVSGDARIRIPPESMPGQVPKRAPGGRAGSTLSSEDFEVRLPRWDIDPPLGKRLIEMPSPTLSDNVSDASRLIRAHKRSYGVHDINLSWPAMRKLASAARDGDWTVTATVGDVGCGHHMVFDVEPGDATATQYAVAIDVGTTTIDGQLIELGTGNAIAHAAEYNAQSAHGEDVITRIIFGSTEEGLATLKGLVAGSVRSVVERMLEESGVSAGDIVGYTVAGNTVMTHLMLGLSPATIRNEPYVPTSNEFPWARATDLGLPGSPETRVLALPCPASYVGGDIVAGLLASGIPWSGELSLFIDIGTNGELVLGNKEWLVACSCSAGPAFEGGGMLHGMRAADGAIEQVRIDPTTLEPMVLTIGLVKPVGICGSGLIDSVAELFLAGALDRSGRFDRSISTSRLREGEHGWEYALVFAPESGTGADIVLTEADVENLMRAKAAIFAGISVLMESVDVEFSDISEVLVAGSFGHYLELDKVLTLGLLPEAAPEKFKFIGNGSLLGARLAAASRTMLCTAQRVAEKMTYLELSANAAFMEMYVSAMFLPHTDSSLFPGVEARLAATAREA